MPIAETGPEFVLINKEPEPDPEDPTKLVYTEEPLILHTRSGRLINYIEDEEHGLRLFWQPPLEDGQEVDPDKVEFLPLGFDEFYGLASARPKKQSGLMRVLTAVEDKFKPLAEGLEKWAEERRKKTDLDLKLIDQELEFIEAEICLEEAIEDMELELKMRQEEEEKRAAQEEEEEEEEEGVTPASPASPAGGVASEYRREEDNQIEEEGEEEDDEEGGAPPSSFGSVPSPADNRPRKSGFSSLSLSLVLPPKFSPPWKSRTVAGLPTASAAGDTPAVFPSDSVRFPPVSRRASLRLQGGRGVRRHRQGDDNGLARQMNALARALSGAGETTPCRRAKQPRKGAWASCIRPGLSVLSLHVPLSPYVCSDERDPSVLDS